MPKPHPPKPASYDPPKGCECGEPHPGFPVPPEWRLECESADTNRKGYRFKLVCPMCQEL